MCPFEDGLDSDLSTQQGSQVNVYNIAGMNDESRAFQGVSSSTPNVNDSRPRAMGSLGIDNERVGGGMTRYMKVLYSGLNC